MKISRIEINNFVGISEFKVDLGKINILTGRVGSGKTSIIEAIEKGFSNKSQRVEVIRHGEEAAKALRANGEPKRLFVIYSVP